MKMFSSSASHPGALEAGDMSDKATKKSATATALTAEAAEVTKNAGDTKDGHTAASTAHKAAYDAHKEAYTAHAKAGSPDSVLEAHMDAMTSHKQHMADHAAACEACQAKTAAELLTTQVHACHAELQASGLNPSLDDLKHAVFNKHGVLLKQAELAKHLSTKLEAGGPGSGPRKGMYPHATLKMNGLGHIHAWPGKVIPEGGNSNPTVGGKESPVYLQNEDDIKSVKESLTPSEVKSLENGYHIHTKNFSDEHFG